MFTAPRIACDGGLLAWRYCGLIFGYTVSFTVFVGEQKLDKVLQVLDIASDCVLGLGELDEMGSSHGLQQT